jgi:hypothetical protein
MNADEVRIIGFLNEFPDEFVSVLAPALALVGVLPLSWPFSLYSVRTR